MKIKIIGDGGFRVSDDMLVFKNEDGEQLEIDFRSAEEILLTLLDALEFSAGEMDKMADTIEDKLEERGI